MTDYKNLYDVIIIGGGPAGLSAAIYAARAKEKVLVIEKRDFGGQIALTEKVMNYPGVESISGRELTDRMVDQAKSYGAQLMIAKITSMELDAPLKKLSTNKGEYSALAVIIASGALPKNAGFEGEQKFAGSGVAYCATCDGPLFAGCELFVVGGGPAAVEEAIFLTKFATKITLVVREDNFTCSQSVADKLKLYPDIEVLFHTEIVKVDGLAVIDHVTLRDNKDGRRWTVSSLEQPLGVFVFVGYEPDTAWLPSSLKKDGAGYLLTDVENHTNLSGVSAAGDIRQKSLRQVVTAAADGAIAAVGLENMIKTLHEQNNIPPLLKEETSVLSAVTSKAIVRVWTDDSVMSEDMVSFLQEQKELRDKVVLEIHDEGRDDITLPSIEICQSDGTGSGIHFHAVPKGLEWNSFQMALFNVAGPGQKVSPETARKIGKINRKMHLMILATTTCGNCPSSVMSACQIAALNKNVTTEIYDVVYFRKLRFKYQITSVPVLVVDGRYIVKGKMNVDEMIDEILKLENR